MSPNGTKLPRTCATARPQEAKADTKFQADPLVNYCPHGERSRQDEQITGNSIKVGARG